MLDTLLEIIGFVLVVAAAYTVAFGLALLVAGVGFIVLANAPNWPFPQERPKTDN